MKEYKFIALILAIVLIGLGCVRFCNHLVEKTIDQTIKNAVLVESNESGYTLNFYGQEYDYSFD
jgi:hypothetical protein|uniref:GRB2-binding adapter n=1 Tax=Bacteriophage sp. TaxID=38018 RepID=A0A8D9UHI5_9VIRU|nr:MAG TPA: GRB2-binding adapter [Bacteriophage sp.]